MWIHIRTIASIHGELPVGGPCSHCRFIFMNIDIIAAASNFQLLLSFHWLLEIHWHSWGCIYIFKEVQ